MNATDELIETLAGESEPVSPVRPRKLVLHWAIFMTAYCVLLVSLHFALRPDLASQLGKLEFIAEIALLGLIALDCGACALLMAYPDYSRRRMTVALPLIPLVACALLMTGKAAGNDIPDGTLIQGLECAGCILVLAMPPALWLLHRIRRLAATRGRLDAALALAASGSVGALILRLSEPADSVMHVLCWHCLPVALLAALGLWLGGRLLKW